MARPHWFIEMLKKTFPQRFLIAKLSRLPLIGRIMDYLLFHGDDIMYLPKDQVIQSQHRRIAVNKVVEKPEEMVLPSQIVEHFIEQANYHWIMNFCLCRTANKCKDYPAELGCLFLGEAVLNIDPHLGRFVTKEEALEHVRLCREAGLVHLIGRNKVDSVWLDVGPGEKLLTICNCCECCCLWRMIPNLSAKIQKKITRMPGVRVTVTDRCIGCGECTQDVCFVDAIHLVNDRAVISDMCRGCGRCVTVCKQKAIVISIDNDQFVEKSIERISTVINVK